MGFETKTPVGPVSRTDYDKGGQSENVLRTTVLEAAKNYHQYTRGGQCKGKTLKRKWKELP